MELETKAVDHSQNSFEIKAAFEDFLAGFEAFKDANDARLKGLEKRGDVLDTEKVARIRATSLAFNAQAVDVTNADSAGMWRELLDGGIKSAGLSGSGVFKDAASDAALRQAFFDGTTANYQVVVPGFGIVEGPFRITQLQYDGPHDGEVKVSLALASAGALAFTAS